MISMDVNQPDLLKNIFRGCPGQFCDCNKYMAMTMERTYRYSLTKYSFTQKCTYKECYEHKK